MFLAGDHTDDRLQLFIRLVLHLVRGVEGASAHTDVGDRSVGFMETEGADSLRSLLTGLSHLQQGVSDGNANSMLYGFVCGFPPPDDGVVPLMQCAEFARRVSCCVAMSLSSSLLITAVFCASSISWKFDDSFGGGHSSNIPATQSEGWFLFLVVSVFAWCRVYSLLVRMIRALRPHAPSGAGRLSRESTLIGWGLRLTLRQWS